MDFSKGRQKKERFFFSKNWKIVQVQSQIEQYSKLSNSSKKKAILLYFTKSIFAFFGRP